MAEKADKKEEKSPVKSTDDKNKAKTQSQSKTKAKPEKAAKAETETQVKAKKSPARKSQMRKLTRGKVFIKSTYNNTVVTVTDLQGNAVAWQSAGSLGFKGAKKSTPYAATQVVKQVIDKVKDTGLSDVDVFVRGIGGGRESAVRALHNYGLVVNSIKDVTPVPHNGCRPKKVRRV